MVSYVLVKLLLLTSLLSAYLATSYGQLEDNAQPEVTIPQGTILGTTLKSRRDRDIFGFQGIPYGQPPIGNLRFANPVAAGNWSGILNGTDDTRMCPQMVMGRVVGDEDCLYLNVYTPQLPQDANSPLLPVIVYVHGGAFRMGSFTATNFGPGHFLDEDVIFVIANYRLGSFGFLSTGDEVASGNWGLKDQVLVLKWVRDNIRYFGGDHDRVTLVGQGAAAGAVEVLTLSNATIGLFHRYVTQSGSGLATYTHRPSAAYARRAFELGEFVGCSYDTSDSLIKCLLTVNISTIVAADSQFSVWHNLPDFVWSPTDEPDIEGAILLDSPSNLFAAGAIRDLPWISGVVRDDGMVLTGGLFSNEERLSHFLQNFDFVLPIMLGWRYKSKSTQAILVKAAKSYYLNDDLTMDRSILVPKITMLVTDAHFYYPARNAIQQRHALSNNPQYFYTFNYNRSTSTGINGIGHSSDLRFFFPRDPAFIERDYGVVDAMIQLWTSFATNGTPTASALNGATWEPYSPTEDRYLRIGNGSDPALELLDTFFVERMQFWADIYAFVEAQDDDSGTSTLSPNSIFVFLVIAGAKFVLSAGTSNILG